MINPHKHRLLVVIWAVLETAFFGGIIHGWASLVYVVKEDGIYSFRCVRNLSQTLYNQTAGLVEGSNISIPADDYIGGSVKCKAQDSMIALGQTIANGTSFIGVLIIGQLHQKLGTKRLRIVIWLSFLIGCLCVAFVTNDAPWVIFVAYWMFRVSGLGLLTTNIQVSFLYVSAASTVVSLVCGGFDFAGSMVLFIKLAYEAGVSLKVSYIALATGSVMTVISAICWLPWGKFTIQTKAIQTVDIKQQEAEKPNFDDVKSNTETLLHSSPPGVDKTPALKACLMSSLFLVHIVWYIILYVRFMYFIDFLNPFLIEVTGGDTEEVSHFTNVFLYVNMVGFVTSFLVGIVYDWQKSRYKDSTPLRRSLLPAVLPLTLTTCITLLVSVLILIPHVEVLYAVFILITTYRSFLFSTAASFLSQVFPAQHFSVMYTILIIAGNVFAFLQYALYSWSYAYDGAYRHVSIMLLCLVFLSLIHPANIVVKCRRETSGPVNVNCELAELPKD